MNRRRDLLSLAGVRGLCLEGRVLVAQCYTADMSFRAGQHVPFTGCSLPSSANPSGFYGLVGLLLLHVHMLARGP